MAVGGIDNNFLNAARSIDHSAQSVDLVSISKQPEYISFQLERVLKDGKISAAELKQYPELVHHIEVTLGYGSVADFVNYYAGLTSPDPASVVSGEMRLPKVTAEAIRASISGSVGPAQPYVANTLTGDLPTNIDPASTFVVFELQGGQTITFDGPEAGELALDFATIYNNSETFRTAITDLADANGDRYFFHSLPFRKDSSSEKFSSDYGSGGFINSKNISPQGTKILEFVSLHQSPSSSDQQATFHSTVLEELADNNIQF